MNKSTNFIKYSLAIFAGFSLAYGQINSNGSSSNYQAFESNIQLLDKTHPTQTKSFEAANEIVSLRTLNSKHFKNTDGTFTAVINAGPLHYQENGQFKTIDQNLTELNDAFVNTHNLMKTSFGKSLTMGVESLTKEGKIIEFLQPKMYWENHGQTIGLKNASDTNATINDNQVIYANLWNDISARFTLLNGRKKLDYIIPNRESLGEIPQNAQYLVFTENIQLPHNWSHTTTSKGIHIKDQQNNVIYLYENPTSNDAKDFGLFNSNTIMDVEKNGNVLTLKIKVDAQWLLDNDRVFPLTIDPTTTVYPMNEDFWTVQVNSQGDGQSGLPAAGRVSSGIWFRGAITFDTSSIPPSDILDAQIVLTTINKVGNFSAEFPIGITQSNYDLPVWADDFLDVYNYITHPANMAGDYVAINNPGEINSTQTYNLGNTARNDIAKKTGSLNSFFSVSLRQGWDGGALVDRYVVYADHTHGEFAPQLILNYEQNDDYCRPMHLYSNCAALGDCEYIGIANVNFDTLDNSTSYDNIPIGYNRYNFGTEVGTEQTQQLNITYKDNGVPSNGGKIGVWIDWNGDGAFASDEFIGVSNVLTDGQVYSLQVTVPGYANLSTTRMRIRSVFSDEELNANDACSSKFYGESEDYDLTIGRGTMSINDTDLKALTVYPNPTHGILNIVSQTPIEAVTIYALNGQEMLRGKTTTIDASHLPNGTYVVTVQTTDGKIHHQKFIKK